MVKKNIIYPWSPAEFKKADAVALQSLVRGQAEERHQKRVLNWILNNVCELHGLSFRPDDAGGTRASDFAEGKRWVALQICKLINANIDEIKE